ncbi:hypothetical protein FDV58_24830 [Bradyrhizobium elkanii]|uniref:Uncharacterized protein n=1 Tax=Bradyrhizobium elkanii TaxID=29448 RepID=A0A4U6RUZ5_BRAEL|nr:hypothetical protein [Bradyrhizobium elkanii]TKV78929.1 hypothetical protein FDV58_24830 [Bradyrhizobium elkanii]
MLLEITNLNKLEKVDKALQVIDAASIYRVRISRNTQLLTHPDRRCSDHVKAPRPQQGHSHGPENSMAEPKVYDAYTVIAQLKLWKYEIDALLEIGIIVPVGRSVYGHPLFSAEAIDRLASKEHRERIRDALWWDFQSHPDRRGPRGRPWVAPVELPFYPFDSEEQHQWAKKLHTWKKQYAPFPHRHGARVTRFKQTAEDKATREFQKAHGIKRNRARSLILVGRRRIPITRGQLFARVWRKTMARVAADLSISERALREVCKKHRIPMPTRGHFNHKNAKDRPPKPKLPPLKGVDQEDRRVDLAAADSSSQPLSV